MSDVERLSISRAEYAALNDIRGLEQSAHSMVMLAKQDKNGRYILEGTSEAFNALQRDLSDEIYHELSPPTRLRQIRKLYDRLSPDNDL